MWNGNKKWEEIKRSNLSDRTMLYEYLLNPIIKIEIIKEIGILDDMKKKTLRISQDLRRRMATKG